MHSFRISAILLGLSILTSTTCSQSSGNSRTDRDSHLIDQRFSASRTGIAAAYASRSNGKGNGVEKRSSNGGKAHSSDGQASDRGKVPRKTGCTRNNHYQRKYPFGCFDDSFEHACRGYDHPPSGSGDIAMLPWYHDEKAKNVAHTMLKKKKEEAERKFREINFDHAHLTHLNNALGGAEELKKARLPSLQEQKSKLKAAHYHMQLSRIRLTDCLQTPYITKKQIRQKAEGSSARDK